jgi:hypothetical protein
VQALNLQQERAGTLFEGRFKHRCVDKWEYLMMLCRYIHLNPVKAKLVTRPEDWAYSNYREWIGMRDGALVDKVFVQDHFSSVDEYVKFVSDVEDLEFRDYEQIPVKRTALNRTLTSDADTKINELRAVCAFFWT